jgi:predicted phosphodiesterase
VRVAALYDVHGMPQALSAVLADVGREGFDAVVFGGDVFEGPFPGETLELVTSMDARFLRGNCERDPVPWLREKLSEDVLRWAANWPETVELDDVLHCHATPRSDDVILTESSSDERFAHALAGVENRLVVAGHTHMQYRRGRYVNAGSVGMPYEGEVAAFWAVVSDDVEFRRTPFDVERAIAEIEASGWPGSAEFVAENLRVAPTRREAAEYFESLA